MIVTIVEFSVIREHQGIVTIPAIADITSSRPASHRAVLAIATSLLLGNTLFLPSAAQAAPAPTVPTPHRRVEASDVLVTAGISGRSAKALAESLGGSRTAGVFINGSGRMVVAVTDQAAAQAVRDAGGVAQVVTYSTHILKSIHSELDKLAGIPGTSWGVDPATNQVSVELDSTVNAADTARLKAVTDKFGSAIRVDRVPGKVALTEYSSGGDGIEDVDGGSRCSLGFNVTDEYFAHKYFITAGHCVVNNKQWYLSKTKNHIGYRVGYSHPGNDYGLVIYENLSISAYGTVYFDRQQIVSSRYPYDGEKVSRDGRTSTDLVGQVLLTSTTVTVKSGETYYGMIKTSNCGLGGDSGGPLFDGTVGLGTLTASNGTSGVCTTDAPSGDRTYYQPLQEVLNVYGLYVY